MSAREIIAREEETSRIYGFVNEKLREDGELIVSCSRNNPQLNADYKRLGRGKAYEGIQQQDDGSPMAGLKKRARAVR